MPRFLPRPRRTLASPELFDAWTDFFLSRQTLNCTAATLHFYNMTSYKFLLWAEDHEIFSPRQIQSLHVRQFLSGMQNTHTDRARHAYARGIKTLTIFFHEEKYMPERIKIDMPKLSKKVMPYLTSDQLRTILSVCTTRDRAMIMFLADCGCRVSELCNLNWGDADLQTGMVRVIQGKGQKDRAVIVGVNVRRALLKYRRSIEWTNETPLFLSRTKDRLTRTGVLIICRRLEKATGIHITPHAMRRTFVMLSLENQADPGHIQRMLGHASLDMVYYYADMANINLLQIQHRDTSPIDRL